MAFEINIFMFDVATESFNDVVKTAPTFIHTVTQQLDNIACWLSFYVT